MTSAPKLLSRSGNYAVVQLPGRNYPGVVMQGDSLHGILAQVGDLRVIAARLQDIDLSEELESLHELLLSVQEHFEMTCEKEGIELPYTKAVME